jgi:hypothetical protein
VVLVPGYYTDTGNIASGASWGLTAPLQAAMAEES